MVVATPEIPLETTSETTSIDTVVTTVFPKLQVRDWNCDRVVSLLGDWEQFEYLQKGFSNHRSVRLSYLDGVIEIFMPGKSHEIFKTIIGMLIEFFLIDHEIEFEATGQFTQKIEGKVAAEADESYEINGLKLSIEINFSSGGIEKLQKYQLLGVNEVWFWEDGVLAIYHLESTGYTNVTHSKIPALAVIEPVVLCKCILAGETSKVNAVKMMRSAYPVK